MIVSLIGAVTVAVAIMYAVLRLGAICEGREW